MNSKDVPLVGADPELFLLYEGNTVPAFDLIGGTKDKPIPIPGLDDRSFFMQEDGAACEFNVPPSSDSLTFSRNIRVAIDALAERVIYPKGRSISNSVQCVLTEKMLERPQAKAIGCMPDFNAYAKDGVFERQPFTAEMLGDKRYAGGHLHIQYNKDALPEWAAARFLDLFLGLPSLRFERQLGRRSIYGRPGLYRPKPYGVEYRTLSNFWLFLNRDRQSLLINNAFTFSSLTFDPSGPERLHDIFEKVPWDSVESCILNEDNDEASMLMDKCSSFGLPLGYV